VRGGVVWLREGLVVVGKEGGREERREGGREGGSRANVPRLLTSTAKQAANWDRKALVAPYLGKDPERVCEERRGGRRRREGGAGRRDGEKEREYVHGGEG